MEVQASKGRAFQSIKMNQFNGNEMISFRCELKVIQNFKWLYRVDHNTISANLAKNQHKTIDQKLYKAQNKQPTEKKQKRSKKPGRTLYYG